MFFKYKNLFFISVLLAFNFFVSTTSKAENGYLKINYGLSNHDMGTTTTGGTITHDDEDQGFILSGGSMIGEFWGIDLMYYDLGSSSLSGLDVGEQVTIEGINHVVTTAGTISNDISGFGAGFIFALNNDSSELYSMDTYVKAGVHSWDKSGSTTLMANSAAFNGSFFSKGIGAYAGLGVAYRVTNNISIDFAYDVIGLSKDASFDSASSLISIGLRTKL